MTYLDIHNYLNHRIFQNNATETVTNSDVVFAINVAQTMLITNITHPKQCLDVSVSAAVDWETSETKATTFTFDSNIKKINKLTAKLTEDTSYDDRVDLVQVFTEPRTYAESWRYEYVTYLNTIKTGDEFREIIMQWEVYLPAIVTGSEWTTPFPLGDLAAHIVTEYAMSILVPTNLIDGYQIAQYHEWVYNRTLTKLASQVGNIAGVKQLKNQLK